MFEGKRSFISWKAFYLQPPAPSALLTVYISSSNQLIHLFFFFSLLGFFFLESPSLKLFVLAVSPTSGPAGEVDWPPLGDWAVDFAESQRRRPGPRRPRAELGERQLRRAYRWRGDWHRGVLKKGVV